MSVAEATITKWLKKMVIVSLDEPIVEIATDKVTDVTSEVEGIILEQKFNRMALFKLVRF